MISGKLKRSLRERCPICGSLLQLRYVEVKSIQRGNEVEVPLEFIACSSEGCEYEREVEQKRRRRQEESYSL